MEKTRLGRRVGTYTSPSGGKTQGAIMMAWSGDFECRSTFAVGYVCWVHLTTEGHSDVHVWTSELTLRHICSI
jgi:hypothetical protein